MDQRSRVHRPAAHRRGHARWRLPMQPCNSSEFCCEDGPGRGAEEKGALWRQWRGNEQAGFEAHRERSRDGGGVSVPGPCGLRTATGGDHPRVGCCVRQARRRHGRPEGSAAAHWHSDTLSPASWVGLAAHKADSFSGCGQACASTTFLLGLRTGCTVCPSPAQAASSRAATTTARMTPIPHLPEAKTLAAGTTISRSVAFAGRPAALTGRCGCRRDVATPD